MADRFVAAAVQATPVYMDLVATVDKVVGLIAEAAGEGAELVVFPESFVPGFPYWPRANPLPHRDLSIQALERMHANSFVVGGSESDRVAQAARQAGVHVVLGVTERDDRAGTTLFNSLVWFGSDGGLLAVQRKLLPTFDEHCVWGLGDGSHLRVVETRLARMSGLVCGNNSMTLAKAALLMQGEQVHVAAWPGYGWMLPTIDLVSRGYANEGGVYVIAASSFLTAEDVPDDFVLKDATIWDIPGGSGIVSPRGEWLAGPVTGREAIVMAEIDLGAIVAAKATRDVVGNYARPDVLRLMVDHGAQRRRGQQPQNQGWVEYG